MQEKRLGMEAVVRRMHLVIDKGISILCDFTALLAAVFMSILFFQVMMRYVFVNPIYGIDEAVTAMMIWAMSLGFVEIYWYNENAVIEFIVKKCPGFVRVIMNYVTEFIVLLMGAILVPTGMNLFSLQIKTISLGGLPFSKAYYYALPVTVMGALLAILALFRLIEYTITRDEKILRSASEEEGMNID